MPKVRALAFAATLVVALYGTRARASEDSFLFGDHAALTGGAVVSSISDTASIWYNPAGLGQNRRGRIEISGTAFTARWRRIRTGLAVDLPGGRVQRYIESRQTYVVPTAVAFARGIGDGLTVGVGLFVTEEDLTDFERGLQANDGR